MGGDGVQGVEKTRGSRILVLRSVGSPRVGILNVVVLSRGRDAFPGFPARESQRAGTAEVHSSAGRAGAGRGGDYKSLHLAAGTLGLEGRLGAPVSEAPSSSRPPPSVLR